MPSEVGGSLLEVSRSSHSRSYGNYKAIVALIIPEPRMKSMMPLSQSSVDLSNNQVESVS